VEEYQYQKALRHFAKKHMEDTGDAFLCEAIPYEAQKNAKEMRIRGLEGYVKNGMMHILEGMTDVVQEFEDYPYGATKDILDMLGYAVKHTPISSTTAENECVDPFSMEAILDGIKSQKEQGLAAFSNPLADVDDGWNDRFVT
jgi:hypothetical protein